MVKNGRYILWMWLLLAAGVFADTAPETPYLTGTNNADMGWPSEGWRVAKRSPSGYEWDKGEEDEVVDFTIFQADDGSWQIIGCVRWTTFPEGPRLLYQWETTNFFSSDWTEIGVFLTTDDGPVGIDYAEGTLQAPYVIKDGNIYYMIYNSRDAHMMVSTNGLDWTHQTNYAGSYTHFDTDGGRDITLLDNRDVDGKWYAIYCPATKGWDFRGYTNVYRSASSILGPWSDSVLMARRDYWQDVESPSMVRRGGWYYLFLQDWVFAQPGITNFFGDPNLTDLHSFRRSPLRGIAPEIIRHEGQDYMACYNTIDGNPLEGIEIRPLYWAWTDTDSDGLPDYWESQHYGSPTSAVPIDAASNGVDTVYSAYIAGIDPMNPTNYFELSNLRNVLQWVGVSGRVYNIYWTSNLLENFQTLETNVLWTSAIFTDTLHSAQEKGFYKIEVQLEQ